MSLQVVVIGATNVPNPETFGKCDPYTSITFQGQKKKTEVIKSEVNPTWNQVLEFNLQGVAANSTDELVIEVKDWERVGRNRLLGSLKLKLNELTRGGKQSKSLEENLLDSNGRPHQAQIRLKITYDPPEGSQGSQSEGSHGQVVDQPEDEDEDEDEVDNGDEADGGGGLLKRKRKRKMGKRKIRQNLSNKPQDFQVCNAGEEFCQDSGTIAYTYIDFQLPKCL